MSKDGPLAFSLDPTCLPEDSRERHEALVDLFGQFLFSVRNCSLASSRTLIESQELRQKLGSFRRAYYEGVAQMPVEEREAALLLAQETLDGFIERLIWAFGDEGTDARFGPRHAYRYRLEMEVVDVETDRVVDEETINRGGKFFGSYWGKWLNRFGKATVGEQKEL